GAEPLARTRIADIGGVVLHTRDHAQHIAIEDRPRQAERDAADRGGRVVADARQRADRLILARKAACRDDLLRSAPQIAGARVIAEPRPGGQDIVLGRAGQRLHSREALQKALIVGDDGLGARLLEHDLAHPDAIGIGSGAPGKIAMTFSVPVEEEMGEAHSMTRSHSATTSKSSASTSHAWNSGFKGCKVICSCTHWSSPVWRLTLVYRLIV